MLRTSFHAHHALSSISTAPVLCTTSALLVETCRFLRHSLKKKPSLSSRRLIAAKKSAAATTTTTSSAWSSSSSSSSSTTKLRVGVLHAHPEARVKKGDTLQSPAVFYNGNDIEFTDFIIRKSTAFKQLRQITAAGNIDVFWNNADGPRDCATTGETLVRDLENLNVAYTGSTSVAFEPTKVDMKLALSSAGVKTPNFAVLYPDDADSVPRACSHLRFPVIVKHLSGYGSVGIDETSKCADMQQLVRKAKKFVKEFDHALVEEFITGEEGTVLVAADPDSPTGYHVFPPLMISVPGGDEGFLDTKNKWFLRGAAAAKQRWDVFLRPRDAALREMTADAERGRRSTAVAEEKSSGSSSRTASTASSLTPSEKAEIAVRAEEEGRVFEKVHAMAANAFFHILGGIGYGRVDFRIDRATKQPMFIEINSICGIFLPDPKTGKPGDPLKGAGDFSDMMIARDAAWGGHNRFIRGQLTLALRNRNMRVPWWIHSYSSSLGVFTSKAARYTKPMTRVFAGACGPVPCVVRTLFDVTTPSAAATSLRAAAALLASATSAAARRAAVAATRTITSSRSGDEDEQADATPTPLQLPPSSPSSSPARGGDGAGRVVVTAPATSIADPVGSSSVAGVRRIGFAAYRMDNIGHNNSFVLLQHSCDPNCGILHSTTSELVTLRPIAKNEPLTIDAFTLRDPSMPVFKCACGHPRCRGVVRPQKPKLRESGRRGVDVAAEQDENIKTETGKKKVRRLFARRRLRHTSSSRLLQSKRNNGKADAGVTGGGATP